MVVVYDDATGRIVAVHRGPLRRQSGRTIYTDEGRVILDAGARVAVVDDQPVDHIMIDEGMSGVWPDDFVGLHDARAVTDAIDAGTSQAIEVAVHPLCGAAKERSILREQLADLLTHFGITSTADFARLQGIVATEKEKATLLEASK